MYSSVLLVEGIIAALVPLDILSGVVADVTKILSVSLCETKGRMTVLALSVIFVDRERVGRIRDVIFSDAFNDVMFSDITFGDVILPEVELSFGEILYTTEGPSETRKLIY